MFAREQVRFITNNQGGGLIASSLAAVALLTVLALACLPTDVARAEVVKPPELPLAIRSTADGNALSYRGGGAFHITTSQVRAERLVAVPGSPVELVLWNEIPTAGTVIPFYAVSLDGEHVTRVRQTSYQMKLQHGDFDPVREVSRPSAALTADASGNVYLVQFVAPPLEEFRAQIEALGGTLQRFVPNHAFIVEMDSATRAEVARLPFVRWVGPYHPAYRLERPLRDALAGDAEPLPEQRYGVQVMQPGPVLKQIVAERIADLGGSVEELSPEGSLFVATLTQEQLAEVVRMDEVLYVGRAGGPVALMNNAREIGGANYIETVAGYTGAGVRAEVMDNGCQIDHPAYAARLDVRRPGVVESHGTGTVGIVFGDGWSSANGRGMLPDGDGVFSEWGVTGVRVADTGELVSPTWQCVFQSNSWGTIPETPDYNDACSELDEAVFDHDIVILQAMGNSGDQNTTREAWSKNVVSVGGVYHNNTLTRADDSWSHAGSIGPAADDRIKPDLCHFYDNIRTTAPTSTYTSNFGGTSGATPIVAGHFGLFFQMWADGIFGNAVSGGSVFDERPHSSTARAVIINTAEPYAFSGTIHDLTRTHQGWGLPDLQYLYDVRNNIFIVDETRGLRPFQTATYQTRIVAGQPYHDELRATLVYTDYPGTTSASQHRINDLSLKVTSPGGTIYWGNNGLRTGNWSTSGGSSNTLDTVENVFIDNPQAGIWTIEVLGDEVIVDTHPSTIPLDADFGLVISGGEYWEDCNTNGINDLDDIAGGTSEDCNTNGTPDDCELVDNDCNSNLVPDDCDIDFGTSLDCNTNGVPDECEPDCNSNGIPDECDINLGSSVDCNLNDVPDECDVSAGTSTDCNSNGIPDECDISSGSSEDCNTNGLPDECDIAGATSEDCNTNGIPDECDLSVAISDASGQLTPLGGGYPQTHVMNAPRLAAGNVTLSFEAVGDLNFSSEYVDVYLNGVWVDEIYRYDGVTNDCPVEPDQDQSVLSAATYNAAAGTGTVTIEMVATTGVSPTQCSPYTWISVAVSYDALAASYDCNTNGIPDECDIAECAGDPDCGDCNTNGIPDACDIAAGTSEDLNSDGIPDECGTAPDWCLGDLNCSSGAPEFQDILYFVSALNGESVWVQYYQANNGGTDPPCPWLLGDYNGFGGVEFQDIVPFANSIGQACIPYTP